MIDIAVIGLIQKLGEEAAEAAGASPDPAHDYGRLRRRAEDINRRYSLMPDADFDDLLPTQAAVLEINRLDHAFCHGFAETPSKVPAAEPGAFRALLQSIAGWSAGIDAAYDALRP